MANTGVKYTIKSISDEGEYYLVKDWRKNKELWVNKSRMYMHPQWWFTSSGKALQSLKSLLKVMDDYLADDLYVIDDQGNETPVDVKALGFDYIPDYWDDDIDACDKIVGGTNPDFAEEKVKFFYNSKFIGSCDPEYIECESLRDVMYSDTELSSLILEYLNSLGDPVFPVSEEDWDTPETDVSKIDIDDLYSTFMQELQFEYNDFPEDFYVDLSVPRSGKHTLEIFTGAVAEDVLGTTKPKYFANMVSCSSDDEGMYSRRYSPGSVGDDGSEDLYTDNQFNSFEEAAEWGIHHDCTHVFDRKTGEYISIADGTVAKKIPFVWDKVWYDFMKENEQ